MTHISIRNARFNRIKIVATILNQCSDIEHGSGDVGGINPKNRSNNDGEKFHDFIPSKFQNKVILADS